MMKDQTMQIEKSDKHWEQIFNVIQKSYAIETHLDFFNWLKNDVSQIVPHDVLMAAWGDFSTGELKYDVASNVAGITTQRLIEAPGIITYLMCNLYKRWIDNDEKWIVINQFDASGIHAQSPTPFTTQLIKMHSLLVYGVKDTRGKSDCIYVFYDKSPNFNIQHNVLGLIMPHLDAALRRVEYLEPPVADHELLDNMAMGSLSDREQEILHWVRSGKTNVEIGMILNISANTVKNHLKRIFQKLDVSCRAQAAAKIGVKPN